MFFFLVSFVRIEVIVRIIEFVIHGICHDALLG